MINIANKTPYLRTSRNFPDNINLLAIEVNRTYVDVAAAVNQRTIGIFPTNRPAVTGESFYYDKNEKQQTLRQLYTFGAIASGTELDIPHGITNLNQFSKIYGTVVTNVAGDYRPLPYIDPGSLTTGMAVLVGIVAGVPSIRIILGTTAVPVVRGLVVLEWLSET